MSKKPITPEEEAAYADLAAAAERLREVQARVAEPAEKHSTLPWRVYTFTAGQIGIIDDTAMIVTPICSPDDAAFIVRAVNCHHDLLAACEAVIGDPGNRVKSAHIDMLREAIEKSRYRGISLVGREPHFHRG